MTINIRLLSSAKITKFGYPIVLQCSHQGIKPKEVIGHSLKEHFNDELQIINEKHPDYDILMPKIMKIKLRARQIVVSGEKDVYKALKLIFETTASNEVSKIDLQLFGENYVKKLRAKAAEYEKIGDLVNRNKCEGNANVYDGCVANIKKNMPNILVTELDYNVLLKFKETCETNGNSKNTIHLYLRTIRALYNQCVKINKLENKNPFVGLFTGLKVRSSNNKKKYLNKNDIRKLEKISCNPGDEKYLKMYLLLFYFGGCDLIDVYYLKNTQIRNGRVRFMRGKLNSENVVDLKIHPKAAKIIDQYRCEGDYVFPWRKDTKGYKTFRGNLVDCLKELQVKHKIVVEPDASYIGIKVARHTFANIGKNLKIEEDLLRELMGHERDEVDNYYKDKFPKEVRDAALFRIIG